MKDVKKRNKILFGTEDIKKSKTKRFDNVGIAKLEKLQDFIDTNDEITKICYDFINRNRDVCAIGYVNNDSVILDGVEYNGKIKSKMQKDFIKSFKDADDFEVSEEKLYAWFKK